MDAVVEIAKAEEQRLLSKLAAIRQLLRAYGEPTAVDLSATTIARSSSSAVASGHVNLIVNELHAAPAPVSTSRTSSVAARVRAFVVPYLQEQHRRMQSNELAEAVQRHGIELGGQKASATLASYLSGMDELDNVRGEGYGLKEWAALKTDRYANPVTAIQNRQLEYAHNGRNMPAHPNPVNAELNTEIAEEVSGQEPPAVSGSRLFGDEVDDPLA